MGGLVKADTGQSLLASQPPAKCGSGRWPRSVPLVCLDSTDSFAIIFNSCPSSGTAVVTAPVFPGFRVVVAGRYLVCRFNQLTLSQQHYAAFKLDPSKSGRKMG